MEKKCMVEKVYDRPKDAIVPTLLSFQNGNLTITDKDRVQYCTMTNNAARSKEALLAVDNHIYTGRINETKEIADTYICIRNKATNKVRILPLDLASMQNFLYTEMKQKDVKAEILCSMSKEAKEKKLAKEFRGRGAASRYDNTEKMQVSVDIIKDDLNVTIQETDIKEEDLKNSSKTSLETIYPKCNGDATELSEIYNINDLIPSSLLDRLDSEAKAVLEANTKSLPIKSKYLLSCIEKLKAEEKNQTEALYKIKIIIFMDCLFNFYTTTKRKIKDIELSGITEKIELYMRHKFFNQPLKNAALSDKAICYYIVLCLLIDSDNCVNVSMLAEELGKPKAKILTYAHLVNALPNRSKSDVVSLRLPSQVPALRRFTKNKKT